MNVIPTEIEYEGRRYRLVEEWSSSKLAPRERHYIAPLNIPTVTSGKHETTDMGPYFDGDGLNFVSRIVL